jgi:hypothetical protein
LGKDNNGFPAFDKDALSIINQRDKRAAESHLPRAERKRVRREREKSADRKARRFNLDVDEDLKAWAKELAKKHACPASQIVQLAMQRLQDQIANGEVELRNYLSVMDGNPRYEYQVERYRIPEK